MRIYFLLLFTISTLFVNAQTNSSFALTHATIINVITGKADADQTIIVDSNRITAVGPFKKIKIPPTTIIIDVTGKFIAPGLVDGHIHFFQSGGLYTRPDGYNLSAISPYEKDQQWIKENRADIMNRYLACGITTVIDVGGPMSNYTVRSEAEKNSKYPNAWVTGPLISTYQPPNLDKKDPPIIKVNNAEEARELVKKQLPLKPDFIKIWYIVLPGQKATTTLPIVKAAIDESHANGLKVAVHATEFETAKLAVENGADILVHSVDDKILNDTLLDLLKSHKTVYIPTLLVAQNYSRTFTQEFAYSAYDQKYANPFMLGSLMDIQHIEKTKLPFDYKKMKKNFPVPSKDDSTMLINLKLAQDKGVLVVSGTDAGNIGTHHASSLYDELLAMRKAGLSNLAILQSATINAAKGFGKETSYGSIEKGKVADMLLLDKNPLDDLSALTNIKTIYHRGVAMSTDSLLPNSPELIVQQQLNAYNLHDIEGFLATYSDDVELFEFPNKSIGKGKEQMRKEYGEMFKQVPSLHCQVTERIVQGNTIIDHESVTGFGNKPLKAIAIYVVEKGKIAKVYFIQ